MQSLCLVLGTKYEKLESLNMGEKMESLELKGTSRIVCSSSSLSKEKIGP